MSALARHAFSVAAAVLASLVPISLLATATASASPRATVRVLTETYCRVDGQLQQMTLFEPSNAKAPAPAVLQVHGGAWERGHRVRSLRQATTVDVGSLGVSRLVFQGFVVASISYQLAPQFRWPDQMEDVTCAMRSLRAHADALGIDPSRIGVLGSSAGAHLASLLATDPNDPAWSAGEQYLAYSARPDALVDEFGPADLTAPDWSPFMTRVIKTVFGAAPAPGNAKLERASPLFHVAAGDPPTLILQGSADNVVHASQSEAFAASLRSASVPVSLVMVAGGPHGLRNPKEIPPPDVLASQVEHFFLAHLG